jgi:hypothetical protein
LNVAAVPDNIATRHWDGKKRLAVKKVKVKVSSFTPVRFIGSCIVIGPIFSNIFTRRKRVTGFWSHSNPPWPYSYSDAEHIGKNMCWRLHKVLHTVCTETLPAVDSA